MRATPDVRRCRLLLSLPGALVALRRLHVAGYRSLRSFNLELANVNLVVGPNGCGKTNVYRALELLHRAAAGTLARALAEEGGMQSVLWAGPRRKGPVRMTLEIVLEEFDYSLQCGLPYASNSVFVLDPEMKQERIRYRHDGKFVPLIERDREVMTARDANGDRVLLPTGISLWESVLAEVRQPEQFPVLFALRQELLSWRFYHQFRTDAASPIREPQVGVRTPVLSHDGRDLAAALQTIRENGDARALGEAIDCAFPGAGLQILLSEDRRFRLALKMPEFARPFEAPELSDGTLHYLCLAAALLSPRPPLLLAINEPETSIHTDLLPALAELIARASNDSQILVTTHSERLADEVRQRVDAQQVLLHKVGGETRIAGA